jgi:hypothetical protein
LWTVAWTFGGIPGLIFNAGGRGGDVCVGHIHLQSDGDVVGHGAHAAHALDDPFRGQLAGVAVDEPGQRDDTILGGDANRAVVYLGIPIELADHGVSEPHIGSRQGCGCHNDTSAFWSGRARSGSTAELTAEQRLIDCLVTLAAPAARLSVRAPAA